MSSEGLSIRDAIAQGVPRIRNPNWALPEDYLKLSLFDNGTHGPWVELWSSLQLSQHLPRPQRVLIIELDQTAKDYIPFKCCDEATTKLEGE